MENEKENEGRIKEKIVTKVGRYKLVMNFYNEGAIIWDHDTPLNIGEVAIPTETGTLSEIIPPVLVAIVKVVSANYGLSVQDHELQKLAEYLRDSEVYAVEIGQLRKVIIYSYQDGIDDDCECE